MKGKYILLSGMFLSGLLGKNMNAQKNTQKIVIQKEYSQDDTTSVGPKSMWSTEFDVTDMQKMHEKIDSIFNQLSGDMNKRIRISAFDSLPEFFNGFESFDPFMDSSFISNFRISGSDKRINDILKQYNFDFDNGSVLNDSALLNQNPDMDVKVQTDTIIKDGSKTVVQRITINSRGVDDISDVFENQNSSFNGDVHIEKGSTVKSVNKDKVSSMDYIAEITLKDAEILNRGGVSPKLIVSPALIPEKQEVNISVKDENGKKVNNVGLSLRFKDQATTELLILDKDGNRVYEDKKKDFSGQLSHTVEVNNSSAPYYFLVIRNNQLFGRKIHDIN